VATALIAHAPRRRGIQQIRDNATARKRQQHLRDATKKTESETDKSEPPFITPPVAPETESKTPITTPNDSEGHYKIWAELTRIERLREPYPPGMRFKEDNQDPSFPSNSPPPDFALVAEDPTGSPIIAPESETTPVIAPESEPKPTETKTAAKNSSDSETTPESDPEASAEAMKKKFAEMEAEDSTTTDSLVISMAHRRRARVDDDFDQRAPVETESEPDDKAKQNQRAVAYEKPRDVENIEEVAAPKAQQNQRAGDNLPDVENARESDKRLRARALIALLTETDIVMSAADMLVKGETGDFNAVLNNVSELFESLIKARSKH
jgi:hypothetical protein